MYSIAHGCAVLYFWNEKVAKKGADNCLSVEHYQHRTYPSGACTLLKWFDGTYSQCNNGTQHRYNTEITDPDIPDMFMYERVDTKIPPTGHTYLPNDTGFGMSEHKDWGNYLAQRYVKTTRYDSLGQKVNISEFHWFNFGYGEVVGPNGVVFEADGVTRKIAAHPGEVWMRRTLEETEQWTIVDLRKNAPQRSRWGKGIRTSQLRPLREAVVPITDARWNLYSAPLPISREKAEDLHYLSKHLPDPAKQALYPPYVPGEEYAVGDPDVDEEPAEEVTQHSEGEMEDSSEEEEESLVARKRRRIAEAA
eukprot:gene22745-27459_t